MKLLNCLMCHDVLSLGRETRKCICGRSAARYRKDGVIAEITGPARLLGMINNEYIVSLKAEIIPYKTTYRWFPIISDELNHVIVLSTEDFWNMEISR